ncbi:MAG: glycosyltransferase family 2 protein [Paludibacter sp.]|nr:glycosyltransferase family 2 protein [Paludibacter sp.]
MNSCSVVILNWNGANYLRRFLPVLISHTTLPGVELVVADNASTDGSLPVLETEFPSIRCIVLDKNYGFAGGYNKAIEQIDSEVIVLLNSDVEVSPGWLEPLLQQLNDHTDVVACQPKIRAFHQREQFEHAGAAGGFIDILGYPFCRGRILSCTETDVAQYDTVRDIFWATGACMVVRTAVYRSCGGLDDDFFAHMEEIDLCWRMQSRGYRITAVPASVVYHVGGGTLSSESPRKTYLNFRNNLLMLYKNLPDSELNRILILRWLLDLVAALHLLLSGKPSNALSVLKAQRDFIRMKKDFSERRHENQQQSVASDLKGCYKGSILFDYYFKRHKTFSSLPF